VSVAWVEDDWSGGFRGIVCDPRIEGALADITRRISEQQPQQRVRRRAVQGLARPSRSAPGTGTCRRSSRDRIAPSSCGKTPTTMYLALRHGIWLPTTRWWRGGHQIAIVEAFAARQRTCSVFIAHDLDSDKTRLLCDGRISAVIHHDLRQDMRQACYAIMQAQKALPGAVYSWPSNIHIIYAVQHARTGSIPSPRAACAD
jgi:hypothetical protein